MKKLRYQVMGYNTIYDPVTEMENRHEAPATIERPWSESAEQHARQVAVGEIEIFDDGEPGSENSGGVDDEQVWAEMAAAIREGVNGVE